MRSGTNFVAVPPEYYYEPFNPLGKTALAESIQRQLLAQPCGPLPPESFIGAGVYALYYSGDFPAYAPVSSAECERPIYVGKAVPPGARKGDRLDTPAGPALASRLRGHARSIIESSNLRIEDFRCRYLIVEDIWIPLGETILISTTQPVWNYVVEGFGKHTSGKGREGGRRSLWDELHPGRAWAEREQPALLDQAGIVERVAAFFAGELAVEEPVEE